MYEEGRHAFTASSPRTYRLLACCVTVPILLVCAFLVWALPQLDPLGQGRANGAVLAPLALGLMALGLLVGVFQSTDHRSAGCLTVPLVLVAVPCALFLASMLSQ